MASQNADETWELKYGSEMGDCRIVGWLGWMDGPRPSSTCVIVDCNIDCDNWVDSRGADYNVGWDAWVDVGRDGGLEGGAREASPPCMRLNRRSISMGSSCERMTELVVFIGLK